MTYTNPNLDIYISRVLKQLHPGTCVTGESVAEFNNINKYLITILMNTINGFLKRKNKKTLDKRDVQTSVRLVFPGEIAKNAMNKGIKSVLKFSDALKEKVSKEKNLKGKPSSRMSMAGLLFPVARTEKIMRHMSIVDRMGRDAPVYLTAVLEYINAEILELAGNIAKDSKKVRIIPRHITLAIMND